MLFRVCGPCIRNAVAECTLRQYSSKYSRVKLFLTLICIIELLVDTKSDGLSSSGGCLLVENDCPCVVD